MFKQLGIRIEGIGRSLTKSGLCFAIGAHPVPAGTSLEWIEGLLDIPGSISTSVEIEPGRGARARSRSR